MSTYILGLLRGLSQLLFEKHLMYFPVHIVLCLVLFCFALNFAKSFVFMSLVKMAWV